MQDVLQLTQQLRPWRLHSAHSSVVITVANRWGRLYPNRVRDQSSYGEIEVSKTWNPDTLEDGTPECLEIEFEDGYKVVCSTNHKFLIAGKWVEAKNLIIGDDCLTISAE